MAYAVLVTWKDGDEEYLCQGKSGTKVAKFFNKKAAKEQRDFMMIGMSDEVNAIEVVDFPLETEHYDARS